MSSRNNTRTAKEASKLESKTPPFQNRTEQRCIRLCIWMSLVRVPFSTLILTRHTLDIRVYARGSRRAS